MKILVIALSGIGDALMFTPSLKKLCDDFPSAKIDILVMYKSLIDLFTINKSISNVLYWDFFNKPKLESLAFVLSLRNKYDVSFNVYPSNRKEYNLISFLISAKKRAAVKYLRKDFINLGFLNNCRIIENDSLHNVEENIILCEKISGKKSNPTSIEINFRNENNLFANEFLKQKNIHPDKLIIGFHPGCSTLKNHDKRRWETSKFAELSKRLVEKKNASILLFGGPEEDYLKEEILKIFSKNTYLVSTNSLADSASLMKNCKVFVTNDSSLMHVAAALKLNVVALLGPTNKNYIYPWHTNYKIASLELDCSPCFYYSPKPLTCTRKDVQFKCIRELSVDLVYSKVVEFIG
jgi:heptosyltransferase-2